MKRLLEFGLDSRYEDLPVSVAVRTRMAILDTLAACVAGFRGGPIPALTGLAHEWGGKPQATILATGRKVPLPTAVLANCATARALDLDDVHEQNTCHVNVSTVPVALALAEARGPIDGRELVAAVALGAEMICRLSAAPRLSFSETGHSLSYQCAFFGAALVAARLMRLSLDAARHAMGIAYAQVAGNQQGFVAGAATVTLMQGIAAKGGVVGALMAERGLTGSLDVLEGRFGYYPVFHRGVYEPADLTRDLGARWLIEEVSIKPVYPCCKFAHAPIDAVIAAVSEARIAWEDIAEIRVEVTNREVHDLVCEPRERKWNPATVTDAQFSLPFLVAWAAVHGGIGFGALAEQGLSDSRVRHVMERVRVDREVGSPEGRRGCFPMPGIVTVCDRSGRRIGKTIEYVKGHPRNPVTYEEIASKFRECAAYGNPEWRGAGRVIYLVGDIEATSDAGALVRLVRRRAAALA